MVPEAFRSEQKDSYYKNTTFLIETVAFKTLNEWDLRETVEDEKRVHYMTGRQGRLDYLPVHSTWAAPSSALPTQGVRCPPAGPAPHIRIISLALASSSRAFSRLTFPAGSEYAHLSHILHHTLGPSVWFPSLSVSLQEKSTLPSTTSLSLSHCPPQLHNLMFAFAKATIKFHVIKFWPFKKGLSMRYRSTVN